MNLSFRQLVDYSRFDEITVTVELMRLWKKHS